MTWQSGWEFLEGVGASDKFGSADYAASLKQGKTKAQIRDYVQGMYDTTGLPGGGQYGVRAGNETVKNLISKDSGFTSSLGQAMGTTASEQQQTHFGGADLLHAIATLSDQGEDPYSGESAIKIQEYSQDKPRSSGYMTTKGYGLQSAATTAQTAKETKLFQANEAKKSQKYYADMLKAQGDQLQAMKDAEAARAADAMKVKYQGSSSVGPGQSAMGIKFKQSPAYASGASSRGTAQLARSGKGSELKTLNV